MNVLCEKADNTWVRMIEEYFASMLRRLQFAFPEGAFFISCADQKLLTLQAIYRYSNVDNFRSAQDIKLAPSGNVN